MLSEMLGNQYFLARNYENAAINLQHVLALEPYNKAVKKKLIICYTQLGQINKALQIFEDLIREDIDFIIDTDPVSEDCPCNELVDKYGSVYPYEENSKDLKLMLGMLWLYCDAKKSIEFFNKVLEEEPGNKQIQSIASLIEGRLKNKKKQLN